MISRLFRKKKVSKHVTWGLSFPEGLQAAYKIIAHDMRLPIWVLPYHILRVWMVKNYQTLCDDKESKNRFADFLTKKYLERSGEEEEI